LNGFENGVSDQEERPPWVRPRLKSAPRIRQLYWCDFPKDAQLPEFWKRRPVIILSKNANLYGTVVIIPCSTVDQGHSKSAFSLSSSIDGRMAWAICDKPTTVAVSRLVPSRGVIPRMAQQEFDLMVAVVQGFLPQVSRT
jgi:mRNA interferase MazF